MSAEVELRMLEGSEFQTVGFAMLKPREAKNNNWQAVDLQTFDKGNLIGQGQLSEARNCFDKGNESFDACLDCVNENILQQLPATIDINTSRVEYVIILSATQRLHWSKQLLL